MRNAKQKDSLTHTQERSKQKLPVLESTDVSLVD